MKFWGFAQEKMRKELAYLTENLLPTDEFSVAENGNCS